MKKVRTAAGSFGFDRYRATTRPVRGLRVLSRADLVRLADPACLAEICRIDLPAHEYLAAPVIRSVRRAILPLVESRRGAVRASALQQGPLLVAEGRDAPSINDSGSDALWGACGGWDASRFDAARLRVLGFIDARGRVDAEVAAAVGRHDWGVVFRRAALALLGLGAPVLLWFIATGGAAGVTRVALFGASARAARATAHDDNGAWPHTMDEIEAAVVAHGVSLGLVMGYGIADRSIAQIPPRVCATPLLYRALRWGAIPPPVAMTAAVRPPPRSARVS